MHRQLKELNGGDHGVRASGARVRRVNPRNVEPFPFQAHPGMAEAFAGEVGRAVEGGVLRYSRRAALLRRARLLGIGRFEANLLIATVLHRHGNVMATADAGKEGGSWGGVIGVVVMVQAMIAGAVWWVVTA